MTIKAVTNGGSTLYSSIQIAFTGLSVQKKGGCFIGYSPYPMVGRALPCIELDWSISCPSPWPYPFVELPASSLSLSVSAILSTIK
jgi:hypothetical protein